MQKMARLPSTVVIVRPCPGDSWCQHWWQNTAAL